MQKNNKKKIFYWSPCLNPVGTVNSTLNSLIANMKYGDDIFDVYLINACGEWNDYLDFLSRYKVQIINLRLNFFKYLPKQGYLQSRFSYLIIYLMCFFPLLKVITRNKPDYFIAHLITSLPLTIMNIVKMNTKFILRISGMPKLNYFRKSFWKSISKKISFVTCPTEELKSKLISMDIFDKNQLYFLPDAIIDIKNFIKKKNEKIEKFDKYENKRLIFAAGRLTKQKNFNYLIDEFSLFCENNNDYNLIVLGDGEKKTELEKKIKQKNLSNRIFLLGHKKNVYKYFKKGDVFVLSSLWEEVGFVMVEAALSNLFIIASNCPNGPKEFLNYGKSGLLFKNNSAGQLAESFKDFINLEDLNDKKLLTKKNVKKYTKFRHFLKLKEILNNH